MTPDMIHLADQIAASARMWAQATAAYMDEMRANHLSTREEALAAALSWQAAMIALSRDTPSK